MKAPLAPVVCFLLVAPIVAAAEVSFVKPPTADRADDGVKMRFAVSGPTDVEVAIVDDQGQVVRHLAAGVLGGENPPPPPLVPAFEQQLTWDGRDDDGTAVEDESLRVRVRLGMRGKFDRFLLYEPDAMPRVTALAPGPKGNLYVFYQDATANGNQGGHKIRLIDRRGRFIRQILPFPADLPYENVKATGAFLDDEGKLVPHIHNWHSLSFYPDTILARGRSASSFLCPVVDATGRIYWVITGGRLCAIEANGSMPYDTFLSPPLFPDLEYPAGRPALAISGDGNHLYVAGIYNGRWDKAKPVPCVWRIDPQTRRCEVFLGDPDEDGNEKDRFTAPRGVAVAGGLLYVSDPPANRVAVFKESDKSFVGQLRVTLPHIVQVHPETGAVYVCSYVPEENLRGDGKCRIRDANLLKFTSFNDAEPRIRSPCPQRA